MKQNIYMNVTKDLLICTFGTKIRQLLFAPMCHS